ncbi:MULTISPECIES: hypothetical protein [Comamonas]|uniref:hypothetical protein n=1 Tax=Comamonas TaxID=283 RepID=UPI00050E696B|nr:MULTISPECIES: hypothetical protein [Comamonas]KGG83605.1 hypothetical protein P369_23350 [Comamonas thiooxydans]KGG96348.1 hypothetical protein P367_20000 [Comamonas thiooxydans]KGH02782.1 hypothetical protein P365_18375 [Comamonas thiooxydans]KGH07767.1 hypothetical protein P368_20665 [Comamonas thiooxydans]MCO8248637.1 hypothetical protein [Comamonas thiooxydans]
MEAIRRRLPAFGAWSWPSIWSRRLHRAAFKTSIQGDADKWQHSSHLPNLNYGRPTLRHVPPVVTELRPASFDSLPWRIADGEIIGSTDAQLARLATAAGHAAHDVRIVCF